MDWRRAAACRSATYLGFRWIDKFGRRKLAIGGYAGMIIFALVAALGLAFPAPPGSRSS